MSASNSVPAGPGNAAKAAATVADLTYGQARDQLVAVVSRLESGAGTLEESLTLWEQGEALAARCQQWLNDARTRLDAARNGTSTGSSDGGSSDASSDSADGSASTAHAASSTATSTSTARS